jgi:hypothetical protein
MTSLTRGRSLIGRSKNTILEFVRVDLELTFTFCDLAKRATDEESRTRRIRVVQRSIVILTALTWKANLEPWELNQTTARLERLKFELENI